MSEINDWKTQLEDNHNLISGAGNDKGTSYSNEVVFTQEGLEKYTQSLSTMIRDNYAFNRQNAKDGEPATLEVRNNLFVNNTPLEVKQITYTVFKYYEVDKFNDIVTTSFKVEDNKKYILIKNNSGTFQLGQLKIGDEAQGEDRSQDEINSITPEDKAIILYINNDLQTIQCYQKENPSSTNSTGIKEYKKYGAAVGIDTDDDDKVIPEYYCIYNANNELVWITFPQTINLGDSIDIKTSKTSGSLTINKNNKTEEVFVGGFSKYGDKDKVQLEVDKIRVKDGFDTDDMISFEKSIVVKGTDEAKRYALIPYNYERFFSVNDNDDNVFNDGFIEGIVHFDEKLGSQFNSTTIDGTSTYTRTIAHRSSTPVEKDIKFDIITFNSNTIKVKTTNPETGAVTETETEINKTNLSGFFGVTATEMDDKCSKVTVDDKYDNIKIYGIAYEIPRSSSTVYGDFNSSYAGVVTETTISDNETDTTIKNENTAYWVCKIVDKDYLLHKEVIKSADEEEGYYIYFNDDPTVYGENGMFHLEGNYLYVKDNRQPYINYREGKISYPYVPLYFIENPPELNQGGKYLPESEEDFEKIIQCQVGEEHSLKIHSRTDTPLDLQFFPPGYYKDNFFIVGVEPVEDDNGDMYYTFVRDDNNNAPSIDYLGKTFNIFLDDEEKAKKVTESELYSTKTRIDGLVQIVGGEACIKENNYILEAQGTDTDIDTYYYLKIPGEFLSQINSIVASQKRVRVLYKIDKTNDINAGVLIDLDNFQNFYTKDKDGHQVKLEPTDVLKGGITTFGGIAAAKSIKGYKVHAAVFNDYAEYRHTDNIEPGRCVVETGKGDLVLSNERMQLGANIVSDTYGFTIGQTSYANTPIAVCGRVLAYPYEHPSEFKPGEAVCSGPNGTISRMKREEIRNWPDAIVGYVSEIPNYNTWGSDNVKVNGRIWIKVK